MAHIRHGICSVRIAALYRPVVLTLFTEDGDKAVECAHAIVMVRQSQLAVLQHVVEAADEPLPLMAREDGVRLIEPDVMHEMLHLLTRCTDPDVPPGLITIRLIARLVVRRDEEALPRLQVVCHAVDKESAASLRDVVQHIIRPHLGAAAPARQHLLFADGRQVETGLVFRRHLREFYLVHFLSSLTYLHSILSFYSIITSQICKNKKASSLPSWLSHM